MAKLGDTSYTVEIPDSVKTLATKNGIDPNNPERLVFNRSGKWAKSYFKLILPDYKETMEKWTKGTRGAVQMIFFWWSGG